MTGHRHQDSAKKNEQLGNPSYLRNMFGRFASGVTVVSCDVGGSVHAMTANSFVSVSLDPARALVSVARSAKMHTLLNEGCGFGVSILKDGQASVSNHFAGRPADGDLPEFKHVAGVPVLADALAWMVCCPDRQFDVDDHTLFVGRLLDCGYQDNVEPLLFFGGKYAALK